MKKYLAVVYLLLFAFAVPTIAAAQDASPTAKAKVEAILAQYPNGGPELAAAIAQAVEADPSLASAVVAVAQNANPAQQQSMGSGLATAASFFANSGTAGGQAAQAAIQTAMASAPPSMLVGFALASGPNFAQSGTGSNNLTTSNCVSPNKPGNGC